MAVCCLRRSVNRIKPYDDLTNEYIHIRKLLLLIVLSVLSYMSYILIQLLFEYLINTYQVITIEQYSYLTSVNQTYNYLLQNLVFVYLQYKDYQLYCDALRE